MKNKISAYIKLARLDKPIGIWLLLLPSLWSIIIASDIIYLKITIIFIIGSVIMRSAGCVINDIWDRKIDAKVQRTKNRPLANGDLSLTGAIIYFVILSLIGLFLLLQLNNNTIILGMLFLLLIICYPLMKRIISVPQIFLGITFNAGVLMSWMAINNQLSLTAWLLFIACFFWTLAYDTIYAHQDKKDDVKIGVKSSAIAFGNNSKVHINLYYILMMIILVIIGIINDFNLLFYFGILVTCLTIAKKLKDTNLEIIEDCLKTFKFNTAIGVIILISLILGTQSLFNFF